MNISTLHLVVNETDMASIYKTAPQVAFQQSTLNAKALPVSPLSEADYSVWVPLHTTSLIGFQPKSLTVEEADRILLGYLTAKIIIIHISSVITVKNVLCSGKWKSTLF